jgi:alpha-tubulin suppressor-like RCC1 family protein
LSSLGGALAVLVAVNGCGGSIAHSTGDDADGGPDASYPSVITPISAGGTVQAVSVGGDFACLLMSTGVVQCLGDDDQDQLGSPAGPCPNSATLSLTCSTTPVPVALVSGQTAIAAGWESTCSWSSDGSVYCWGGSTMGELGPSVPVGGQSGPVLLATGATAIAVGGETSCAKMKDASWKCWGADVLQTDSMGNSTAAANGWNPGVDGALNIGLGGTQFACALEADGTVQCLGTLPWSDSGSAVPPTTVSGLPPIVQLAVSRDSVCGLTFSGQVVCWGVNGFGQLGVPPTSTAQPPAAIPGIQGANAIAVGGALGHFGCAMIDDGRIQCWGADFARSPDPWLDPEPGDACGPQDLQPICSAPVFLPGAQQMTQISADDGVCGVMQDGSVGCLGVLF